MDTDFRPYVIELKRLGFTKDHASGRGQERCYCYTKRIADRLLDVQLWGDGRHRVSHARDIGFGWSYTTVPTDFRTLPEMHSAIAHETTRPIKR